MFRVVRWVPSALVVITLMACGGGGGGDTPSKAPANTTSEVASNGVSALPPLPASVNLTVSPQQFDLLAFSDSGLYQNQDLMVRGRFRGEDIIIGYASEVTPVTWLTFPQSFIAVVNDSYEFPVRLYNASVLPIGEYNTFLRVASGSFRTDTVTGVVDVPIHLRVVAAPPVFVGEIHLSGSVGQLATVARTIPLDFGNAVPDVVTAAVVSDMGDATQWLTVVNDWRTGSVSVKAVGNLTVGTYQAALNVSYTIQGAQGLKAIPVTLEVKADSAIVQQVSPGYMLHQQANQLVVRGHAFNKARVITVKVGGLAASMVEVLSDTEIRASFASTPVQGRYPVQVNVDGDISSLGEVRVLPKVNYAQQDINVPCANESTVWDLIFDASRGNMIAVCDDTYYLISQVEGNWKVVKQRRVEGLGYGYWRSKTFLTPDQKFLVTSGDAKFILLDPATLDTLEDRPIPVTWHQSAGYGFLSIEAVLNNGKLLFTISGLPKYFYVYDLQARTVTRTNQDSSEANVVNRDASALALSTAQLVYVKTGNRPQVVSSDPGLFSVTLFAAPDDWHADYAFPGASPDGQKTARYGYSASGSRFDVHETATINLIGSVISERRYDAATLRFTESGRELYIIDGGQGRFDIFGAVPNDTALHHAITFTPYSYYAALPSAYLTPDQGAVILYNARGAGQVPSIRVLPIAH